MLSAKPPLFAGLEQTDPSPVLRQFLVKNEQNMFLLPMCQNPKKDEEPWSQHQPPRLNPLHSLQFTRNISINTSTSLPFTEQGKLRLHSLLVIFPLKTNPPKTSHSSSSSPTHLLHHSHHIQPVLHNDLPTTHLPSSPALISKLHLTHRYLPPIPKTHHTKPF